MTRSPIALTVAAALLTSAAPPPQSAFVRPASGPTSRRSNAAFGHKRISARGRPTTAVRR